jgi:hypothetical protein
MHRNRRRDLAAAALLAVQLAGCRALQPLPPAGGIGGTAQAETALPPAAGLTEPAPTAVDTVTAPTASPTAMAVISPTLAASATPTATLEVRVPLPGRRLPESAWRTLVRAPGLADMSVASALGPNSHFAVATGNGGLNTLRADLQQPANAWITGVPSTTVLVGVFLGRRRGEGHDLEIVDVAVAEDAVNLAVRLKAPGEWRGSDEVFPVHLIALDRAALPAGPINYRFLDADALGSTTQAPAFDVTLEAVDVAADSLARRDLLIIQSASESALTATPTP